MKNKPIARYQKLALELEKLIESRAYSPGDQIPSVREMCERSGASITTVLNAYIFLERKGLVEARPQRGFYVKRSHSNPPNINNLIPGRFSSVESIDDFVIAGFIDAVNDPKVVQLSELTPSPDLLPVQSLLKITAQLASCGDSLAVQFDDPRGNWELRRQISRHLSTEGTSLEPDEIIVTNGGMESWNLCLRTFGRPGATVFVQPALYFGMLEVIRGLGMLVKEFPCLPDGTFDLKTFSEYLENDPPPAACVVMPSFSSPNGTFLPEEMKKLFVNCLAKKNVPLIEDDVYGDLHFGSRRFSTLKQFDTRGLVIFCSAFTKTLSPGFRIAWLAAGKFRNTIVRHRFFVSIAAPTLTQKVLAEYLGKGYYVRHLRMMRRKLFERRDQYRSKILHYFPEGTVVEIPTNGHAFWVTLPTSFNATKIARNALEKNIFVIPAQVLSVSERFTNSLRINFMAPFTPKIEKSLATLARLMDN